MFPSNVRDSRVNDYNATGHQAQDGTENPVEKRRADVVGETPNHASGGRVGDTRPHGEAQVDDPTRGCHDNGSIRCEQARVAKWKLKTHAYGFEQKLEHE